MKLIYKSTSSITYLIFLFLITSCSKTITDYGFDGIISGKVIDESGNIVPGDIKTTTLMVITLGEGDQTSIDLRVKGDGTFMNSKMYPKNYRIWIRGPVTQIGDTVRVDLSTNLNFVHDFVVIPFITINKPGIVGNPTATTVNISYEMTANSGKTISKREVYCSTNPYPTSTTGSGAFYHTKVVTLSSDNGSVEITGLSSKTNYFLRIGAQAAGATGMNFSEQITFTTP